MPKPYPKEFRDDVIRVARQREAGVTVKQVAADFGISESCLTSWIAIAERDARSGPDAVPQESVDLAQAKRRIRLLERENEVLRRAAAYLSQANIAPSPAVHPAGTGSRMARREGVGVPGAPRPAWPRRS